MTYGSYSVSRTCYTTPVGEIFVLLYHFYYRIKTTDYDLFFFFVDTMAWQDRLQKDKGRTCKTYTDGVDFKIQNPPKKGYDKRDRYLPFDRKWYPYKHKCAGLRYLVTTCIATGWIVAVHGPYPPGKYNDLTIYKMSVKLLLPPGEMVEADRIF